MEAVSVYWLESMDGVTIDTDLGLQSLINRHIKHSKAKGKVFFVSNGIKKFIQFVN